ncbi:MAG: anthranilate synthase component I family protein [Pirellulaceae bacterium]|nr:anthranilate synthase component I family protein [Pirellulaceae bacterium]
MYALELDPVPDPVEVFTRLVRLPHCIFFDSARRDAELGRYSFIAADPFAYWEIPADGTDALALLAQRLAPFPAESRPDLPPFQGGAAGLLSYDLNRSVERLPAPRHDEFQLPAAAIGLYDVVVAFDHRQDRGWILSQGFPAEDAAARGRRAADRAAEFQRYLSAAPPAPPRPPATRPLRRGELAPQFPSATDPALTSNLSAAGYRAAIERAIEYIAAGDVFQVNLAQRLLYPAPDDAAALYRRLRGRNPAPFAGYFDLGDFQIVSASPERFLRLSGRHVETRPIKGTRLRCGHPEADLPVASELRMSEKDRAENIMIVDLLRNDLSRVCTPESIRVTALCRLEVYQYVQHLVSVVVGTLAGQHTAVDLIRACFPGGSVTGAPKVRAMEIIQELEPTARGAYCGSLGYVGFDGALDLSILIRTMTVGRGWCQLPVGGGIVAQSVPEREYEETWHKALGLLRALQPEGGA